MIRNFLRKRRQIKEKLLEKEEQYRRFVETLSWPYKNPEEFIKKHCSWRKGNVGEFGFDKYNPTIILHDKKTEEGLDILYNWSDDNVPDLYECLTVLSDYKKRGPFSTLRRNPNIFLVDALLNLVLSRQITTVTTVKDALLGGGLEKRVFVKPENVRLPYTINDLSYDPLDFGQESSIYYDNITANCRTAKGKCSFNLFSILDDREYNGRHCYLPAYNNDIITRLKECE